MILTKDKIKEEISAGRIKISPFNPRNLGPGSYDLSLGSSFRKYIGNKRLSLNENIDYKKYTRLVKGNVELKPGEFILGITREKISLPDDICGWLGGRTRFARLGLLIHSTAAFLHPGISNRQVLEIYNQSPNVLELKPGTKICQIMFEKTSGKAKYKGKHARQTL